MNVEIIHKANVTDAVLDCLAENLPTTISRLLEVPGGKVAVLKPEQISLQFSPASSRDIGSDIRILVLARSIRPRTTAENKLAKELLDDILSLIDGRGGKCSVTVRLYLTEIGAAEFSGK